MYPPVPLFKNPFTKPDHFLTPIQEKWLYELYRWLKRLYDDEEDLKQYVRTDGTRELTGNWGVGFKKITEVADGSEDSDAVNYGQLIESGGGGIFRFIPQDTDPPAEPGVNIAFMRTGDTDYIYVIMGDGTLRRMAIGYISE